MDMRLKDKVALVTGAGNGIGRAIALKMAHEGARVIVSDIHVPSGEVTVEEIKRDGGEAHFCAVDVAEEKDVRNLLRFTELTYGSLQILVNNAGVEVVKPVTEITVQEWDWLTGVNLKGVFLCTKYGLPLIEHSGGGSITNLASAAGIIGAALWSVYCASKGGVVLFTKAVAQEVKMAGKVRVNCICPMTVDTSMAARGLEAYKRYGFGEDVWEKNFVPRQGRRITPEEVANAAVFLASDESSPINGHALYLDNGALAG
jgi:NAD(P)-dependent dehydrogenase (short-subunit alcohol dehydrogenase family)